VSVSASVSTPKAEPPQPKPRSKLRRALLALAATLSVLLIAAFTALAILIFPIGTGAAAKAVCSDVFISGRDPDHVIDQELPKASFVSYSVDHAAQTVSAHAFGLRRKTAVYRPGLGCALALEVEPAALRAQGFDPPAPAPSEDPWPAGNGPDPRPDPHDLDRPALNAAVAEQFDDANHDPPFNTRAIVVVHRGRIVAEHYAPGFDAQMPLLGWSMTKSVTSALIGILAGRGQIDVDAPISFPEWAGPDDPRAALTWDDLLRMSSGLAFNEDYGLRTDVTVMLFDRHDGSAVPLERELAAPVDTVWAYSSGTTNLLQRRIRAVFDDDAAYHRFPYEALFGPIGMASAVMETDPSGTFVGSSFMYASARDWARFGQLYLQDGVWAGRRILPEGWVARSITPTPTHPSQGYGYQWWLNAAVSESERALPGVPADAYFASGHQGQIILVVPSREAVIVRLGMTNDRKWPRAEFAAAVLAALPR
jgi:CubicO group peptidase (beta-lactamase class C family)